MTQTSPAPTGRPAVFISVRDLERLALLLPQSTAPTTPGSALLAEEVARANICPDNDMPARVVRLGSTVRYRDLTSGRERRITLVLPADADMGLNKVSILAPIGAALIGLPEEQAFSWEEPSGDLRHIVVVSAQDN
jgi:regulator of nucleoside diphosphate kinase